MKKINFREHILPHGLALAVFLVITIFFFNPLFFDHKTLEQGDITQFQGSSKSIANYRDQTGKEALWADAMFSGMPAYLVSVQWGYGAVSWIKRIISFNLPHPICNIFLAFLCYYIMLLAFGIRPYLAIGAAIAFGLSSYMIVGLSAGHNNRIGAIAFMPLVMAGIHLAFSGKRILGFGITATGLALHLRENHLQITYYFALILVVYGLIQLIQSIREKKIGELIKTTAILLPAALLAVGTFFGPLWSIQEYTSYSIRGKSELQSPGVPAKETDGLDKSYAFNNSYGILEPLTLLVPNFYGGSSMNYLVSDQNSEVYKALARSGNEETANQLANYTSAYWGPQVPFGAVPYYAGAIITFLFALGIAFAEKKYVWWLASVTVLGIAISWGSNFESFNYFLFDHFPGYNKFRSVTFAQIIPLFAMPLLGMLGLEKLLEKGINPEARKKLWIALASTGGLCLLLLLFGGMLSFMKDGEGQLPPWFIDALADDRKSLLKSDAIRSLAFILAAFIVIFFDVRKKFSPLAFYAFLIFMITVDTAVVDKRYFAKDKFQRKKTIAIAKTQADEEILKDKSYYRVYNLRGAWTEATTSFYHHSIGGYHGAKLRRYQNLYDSCIVKQTQQLIEDLQAGRSDFKKYGSLNMLNVKYLVYGPERSNIIPNAEANGNAWFVRDIEKVKSPTEELSRACAINTKQTAIIDESKFTIPEIKFDSVSSIRLLENKPNYLKYESESTTNGLAVFSEIYYEKGWKATIDGNPTVILRADYVLRALAIPSGKHVIEFRFEPDAYFVGDKVTSASSWVVLLVLLGSLGWSIKKE